MSSRSSPPFRADHVGSPLRPPELLKAREHFADARFSPAEPAPVVETAREVWG